MKYFKLRIDQKKLSIFEFLSRPLKGSNKSSLGSIMFIIILSLVSFIFFKEVANVIYQYIGYIDVTLLKIILYPIIWVVMIYLILKSIAWTFLRSRTHSLSILNEIVITKSGRVARLYELIDVNSTIKENYSKNKKSRKRVNDLVFKFRKNDIDVIYDDSSFKALDSHNKRRIAYDYLKSKKKSKKELNKIINSIEELIKIKHIEEDQNLAKQREKDIKRYNNYYRRSNQNKQNIYDDLKLQIEKMQQ